MRFSRGRREVNVRTPGLGEGSLFWYKQGSRARQLGLLHSLSLTSGPALSSWVVDFVDRVVRGSEQRM
jgi:hypothetical protein